PLRREGRTVDERELVEAARQGDEDSFAELVRRHSGSIHRVVARMLGDEEEAWDVVQMAWLRAWQRLDRYDPHWKFSTWSHRIATNLAIDVIRARSSRERAHTNGGAVWLRPAPSSGRPGQLVEEKDVERILRDLVDDLTPQQRAAFILREVEGLETAEVARVLGCSKVTVRNHIFQARKALRRAMVERYPEYVPAGSEAR
ncbi:MAG TPA: sigma-70 family RNA polymerase sigma factor, partial [Acidobacteria bacterium]|nr:sigma-70 family RNA polymerase sigma factor [Acidobacteriota bacterium]